MAKAVKLSDIAATLNVSTVTVSKALADKQGVSEELREKIKMLAEEMGYRQPSSIRMEKEVVSRNIGVLASERYLSQYTSFYWEMYQHVVTQGVKKECFCLLEVLSKNDESNLVQPKLLKGKKVEGLIIIGRIKKSYREFLNSTEQIPMVYLDFYDENRNNDAIISDSYYGMYLMTNYLFQMGHRDIAYVGTLLATSSITDRYFGYAKAMMEHGVQIQDEWIISDRDVETGEIEVELPERMPSAFVCNCDFVATAVIKKLQDKSYRVPEDISVVGFDNYLYPGLSDVGITTYEVDMKEMARAGISMLLKKINGDNYKGGIKIIEGRLVIKDSVKDIG